MKLTIYELTKIILNKYKNFFKYNVEDEVVYKHDFNELRIGIIKCRCVYISDAYVCPSYDIVYGDGKYDYDTDVLETDIKNIDLEKYKEIRKKYDEYFLKLREIRNEMESL